VANYVNITKQEMDDFLSPQGFIQLDPATMPSVKELIYAKRVDKDGLPLSLRIYTGINPNGRSRDVGADAIRAQVFWRRPDGRPVSVMGDKRVHRVEGWRKNLQARLDKLVAASIKTCPDCGSPMVERKGRNGNFYGCSMYPECKRTMPKEA
jgi:hypothetical protein